MAQGIVKEVFASRKSSMRNGRNRGMICKTTSSWQVPGPQEEEEGAEALCAHRELCGESQMQDQTMPRAIHTGNKGPTSTQDPGPMT